jgi:predicted nucleotidyltransferase
MVDFNKIDAAIELIASKFNPDKIILFGSYASGFPHEDSDVDLIVVQDSDQPIQSRGFEIRMALLGTRIPIDLMVFTNSEFEKECGNSTSFLNSAMKNAKVMYERAD